MASAISNSSAKVVLCQCRVWASLELGKSRGSAIMAITRSRRREGLEAMSSSTPSLRIIVSTASTWPWGHERVMRKVSAAGTNVSPLRERLMISMRLSGRWERLPRVSCVTVFPLRMDRRSKWVT